jgi:hypothetical protein
MDTVVQAGMCGASVRLGEQVWWPSRPRRIDIDEMVEGDTLGG